MTNIMDINIKFRTKFEKLIQNDDDRLVLLAAFNRFCSLDPTHACNFLWRLTYNSEDDLSISVNLTNLGLNLEIIPLEKISALRNELRYQYEQQYPTFLKVKVEERCKEAFDTLSQKTDPIVATVVYEHCVSCQYMDAESMDRTLWLLNNDQENNFFGGIRSLFFGKDEANYLKPFHLQIHNLLNAFYENRNIMNTPLQGLGQKLEDAGIHLESTDVSDLPFEWDYDGSDILMEEVTNDIHHFKELTPTNVCEYKDVLSSFITSLNQLREVGFDLNEVIAKENAIIALLEAAEALNN